MADGNTYRAYTWQKHRYNLQLDIITEPIHIYNWQLGILTEPLHG